MNGWVPLTTTEARFVAQWVTTYKCLVCFCVYCLNDAFKKKMQDSRLRNETKGGLKEEIKQT